MSLLGDKGWVGVGITAIASNKVAIRSVTGVLGWVWVCTETGMTEVGDLAAVVA